MTDRAARYALKKPIHWLWRADFARDEVFELLEETKITGDWLICPLGEQKKAIKVEVFAADPDIFEVANRPEQTRRADDDSNPVRLSLDDPSPLLVPIFFLGVFNCLIPSLLRSPGFIIPVIIVGVILGQVGLVATWGVFSSADFSRRLAVGALLGLVAYGCLALGFLAVSPDPQAGFVLLFGLMLCPLVLLATQLPLWAARIWFSFEIAKPNWPSCGSYLRPTRIQDLILSTAAVGVALALARLAPAVFPGQQPPEDEYVVFVGVITGGVALVGLGGILPLVYFTLVPHYTPSVLGLAVCVGIGLLTTLAFLPQIPPNAPSLVEAGLLAGASFAVVMCAGLLMTRYRGYRLRRRGRR